MQTLFLDDFAAGQRYTTGKLRVDAAAIKAFAGEFDPQPFHLDEDAARGSLFGGLAASGWHTAAMTMRLLVDSEMKPAGGIIGAWAEELKWPRPIRLPIINTTSSWLAPVAPGCARSSASPRLG